MFISRSHVFRFAGAPLDLSSCGRWKVHADDFWTTLDSQTWLVVPVHSIIAATFIIVERSECIYIVYIYAKVWVIWQILTNLMLRCCSQDLRMLSEHSFLAMPGLNGQSTLEKDVCTAYCNTHDRWQCAFLVLSGWVGCFLVSSPKACFLVSIPFGQLWVSEVMCSVAILIILSITIMDSLLVASFTYMISHIPSCQPENYMSTYILCIKICPRAIACFFKPCWHPEQQIPQTLSSACKPAKGCAAAMIRPPSKQDGMWRNVTSHSMTIRSSYLSLRNM